MAAGTFQRIISDYPQAPAAAEAEYLLGVSDYYSGKWQESIAVLEGFQARHAGSALASRLPYWLGAAWLRLGSYESALRFLGGAAAAEGPYGRHAALLCGVALEGLGKDAEAAAYYRKIMSAGDVSLAPEATYRLAGTEYRAGRFAPARDLYSRMLLDFPQSPYVRDSLFFLAESELALENLDSAEKKFSTVTSVYADSPYREAALYRLADIAYRRHDAAAAVRRLEELGKLYPRGAYRGSAERMRADVLLDQQKYPEAAAGYERALSELSEGSERQAAWYSLGLADIMLGRKTRAAEAFGNAGSGLAKDLGEKALFQRALVLAGLGRSEDAIDALDSFVNTFPGGPHGEQALKLLASLLDSRMVFDKSLSRWDALVRLYPRSASLPEYIYRRGVARMNTGEPAALDDFQRVVKDFPTSAFRDESAYSVGFVYSQRGEYARATPYFQAVALRAAGSDIGNRSSLAVGVCLFNMGSFEQALASLEYLRARQPGGETQATVALYSGRTLYRMEKLPAAAERLADAVVRFEALDQPSAHAEDAADARYWLAWSLYRIGRLEDARDAFISLAQKYPSDRRSGEAWYRAGMCESVRGDDAAAIKLFETVAPGADPWREQALYEKGWALSRMGSLQESTEAFQELAAKYSGGQLAPEAFFKLAMKAYDEGRYPEARAGFTAMIRDFPRSGLVKQALYWIAECTLQSGDARDSLDDFWTSLTSDPGAGVLANALQGFADALKAYSSLETARDFAEKARETQGLDVRVVAGVQLEYAKLLLAKDPPGATDVLEDVRRRSPPEPLAGETSLLMGQALASQSQWQKAIEIFAALSDSRADEVGAQATAERARSLEAIGNLADAMTQYLRISYIFPTDVELSAEGMFNAARLAERVGDRDAAARIEDALRKRYPESQWVPRLQELKQVPH